MVAGEEILALVAALTVLCLGAGTVSAQLPPVDEPGVDYESTWATLTFEIR